MRLHRAALLAPLLLLAVACAQAPEQQVIHDPFESVNRPMLQVNNAVDDYAFGPVARGYKKITPSVFRQSVKNVQRNLAFPTRLVSTLGQGQLEKAGTETGRFLLNSTVGIGGLFDPATKIGMAKYDDDIGKMLAVWHVPPGGYIVVPVLGPSTPRDTFGNVVSMAMNPLIWLGVTMPPLGVLFAINHRAELDDQIRIARESSLDYYVFLRDAYVVRRTRQIRNEYVTKPGEDELDDLYAMPADLYELPDESPEPAASPASASSACHDPDGPVAENDPSPPC